MKWIGTFGQITIGFMAAVFLTLSFAPTSLWYEYESIQPTKPVWVPGEKLQMVSNIVVHTPGLKITWDDQLRCIVDGRDDVIKTVTFPGALKGDKGAVSKIAWTWGAVPDNAPKDVPCYIRSIQTLTLWFGVERTTVVNGETFTISDFDYTKQQQQSG